MKKILLIFLAFITVAACNNSQDSSPAPVKIESEKAFRDTLENINKILIQKDNERINAYIKRMEWNMKKTETGLRYAVIERNNKEKIKNNDIVTIDYQIELLDGTVAYNSDETGYRKLKIGKTDSESGLQEGLKMLGKGDSAVFIAPPYLAKGLLGDFERIPARSILVYKVRVKAIESF
jgi:FKBP-type peptidyl-prolyl cis-trans isomerase